MIDQYEIIRQAVHTVRPRKSGPVSDRGREGQKQQRPRGLPSRESLFAWVLIEANPILYNSLPCIDSPTPKLAAKRSANFLQIQFRFTSDSVQIQFRLR
ncbi:hypothetical protein VN97_g11006 [Penicillium thymicola]|uniref:Uncharacterized protein n=1 Tax=Penicillium thymicola TaxID=293382 RepID=A0AAI9X3L5_PENTH|nr:hypothetical protein VN97_g11006 [Penicillium thymicola]